MMLYTTLKLCKDACVPGYVKLKKSLPKTHKKADLIPLTYIIESNGLKDALWALRATTEDCTDFAQEFALWCAEQALPIYEKQHPDDMRIRDCIEAIRKYINGNLTRLKEVYAATVYAADAADAAYATVYAAKAAYAAAKSAVYAAYAAVYAADAAAYAADAGCDIEAQKEKFIKMLQGE